MNSLILWVVTPAAQAGMNMWGMIVKGGWLMVPIFILSIIAVYIFCERYLLIRRYAHINQTFMDNMRKFIHANHKREAISLCEKEDTPMSRILIKGITHSHLSPEEVRSLIESSANLEVSAMEKGLTTLATCAGMAPMIGFLGTVVGMVQAFYDMSMAGNNINITLLSRGIYTAMITTVAGLIVGIIAYFAYNALVSRIDNVISKMEYTSAEFIEMVHEINREPENKTHHF